MAYQVRTYRDADAPQFDGQPGSLVHVLRKVLTEGYGSGDEAKAPLGWAMEWDSETNNQAAFRSQHPDATQCWLILDDRGEGDHFGAPHGWADGRICYARGAMDFGGWESDTRQPILTSPFPTPAQRSEQTVDFQKSFYQNSETRAWAVIGDEKRFYLFIQGSYPAGSVWNTSLGSFRNYPTSIYFFGDYIPFADVDTIPCAITGAHDRTIVSDTQWGRRGGAITRHDQSTYRYFLAQDLWTSDYSALCRSRYFNRDLSMSGPFYWDVLQHDSSFLFVTNGPTITQENHDLPRGRFPYLRAIYWNSDSSNFYSNVYGDDVLFPAELTFPGLKTYLTMPVDGRNGEPAVLLFDDEE